MKYVFVDHRISVDERKSLEQLGLNVVCCPPSHKLYDAVSGHPDMLMFFLTKNEVVVHKETPENFINKLKEIGLKVHMSHNSLTDKYPQDIILNAVNLKEYFIHKVTHTDKILISLLSNKKLINVSQGYTKCSTAIINDNALITSDKSIAKSLVNENIDILLIPPGDIELPGLNYGFIGGTCGLISSNQLAFYGDLNCYKFGDLVMNFLEKHSIEPIFLKKGKLIDRGSIFSFEKSFLSIKSPTYELPTAYSLRNGSF